MRLFCCLTLFAVFLGCTQSSVDDALTDPVVSVQSIDADGTDDAGSISESTPASGAETKLTPENTRIEFVGTHAGADPDPNARTGQFTDFAGKAVVADDELKAVSVEIQTASLNTAIDKLTTHLKSEDFFDARNYPTARFESTRIARKDDGDYIVTGNLTLLGTTKEVSFPARVGMVDGVLSLDSKLTIDRTEHGMTGMTDKVKKEVTLAIAIGESVAAGR